MMFERKWLFPAIALVAALVAAPAWAQPTEAGVTGVVRDAAKNPIAGATVTATNTQTRAVEKTTSGSDGSYRLVLPPGSYNVEVAAPRFWGPTHQVEVQAGRESRIEFSLLPMLTEVVTVTATKRETDPIDVPFSLEAHTEEDLRNRGADDIEDVAANVASFTVQSLGPGQSQVAMRGVSSGQIARDQPGVKEQVGIYLDESPVSLSLFTPDLDLVDVERVEVLRGPQGTLFGAGSETGTVRYITTAPVLQSTEGFVEFGGGGVEEGNGTGSLKAAINVPLGEKAAARLVGYYTLLPGFIDATQPDLSADDDVNDGARKGGRLAFAFAPTE
jgi:iron complex outermembrane receptor protein